MPQFYNLVLLVAEMAIYFAAMALLFRFRGQLGIGTFFCALGVMHFLETYLASVLYVELPAGIVVSPGSTVLFAGKLVMLLLVFIKEDAATARQPIYGLFIGNFLIIALVLLLRQHSLLPVLDGRAPDFAFMDEMGWLMAWGTTLLFVDSILIILFYQKSAEWLGERRTLRIWLSAAVVLSFDQLGFYLALKALFGMPLSVLLGGWIVKMATATGFAMLTGAYLRWIEPVNRETRPGRLAEIFDVLTYRRRYRELLAEYGRDSLTGIPDRRRYDALSAEVYDFAKKKGQSLSMIVIDIDHFKRVNDAFGHAAGDRTLKTIAQRLTTEIREADLLFRYGGEEFVVLSPGVPHGAALLLAERLRRAVAACDLPHGGRVTISAGVATAPQEAPDIEKLFMLADNRLYRAKAAGRDRVLGSSEPSRAPAAPARPVLGVIRPGPERSVRTHSQAGGSEE